MQGIQYLDDKRKNIVKYTQITTKMKKKVLR